VAICHLVPDARGINAAAAAATAAGRARAAAQWRVTQKNAIV
jgi:hypothetical protein